VGYLQIPVDKIQLVFKSNNKADELTYTNFDKAFNTLNKYSSDGLEFKNCKIAIVISTAISSNTCKIKLYKIN